MSTRTGSLHNTLSAIRLSTICSLWTDEPNLLPDDQNKVFCWEVWLTVRSSRAAVLADFNRVATASRCYVSEHNLAFPEKTVTWMYGSQRALSHSGLLLNRVAELRRAKDTAEFFTGSILDEQRQGSMMRWRVCSIRKGRIYPMYACSIPDLTVLIL